jgi:HEAT repeat protein
MVITMRINQTPCLENEIDAAIHELEHSSWLNRQQARLFLADCGEPAVLPLIKELSSPHSQVRWEAAKALGLIHDPSSASPLVERLMDDDIGVRWTAMVALINLKKAALVPLLNALVEHFDSARLREGAHHVLNELHFKGLLTESQTEVLHSLEAVDPEVECAWAAERALEATERGEIG